MYFQRIVVSVPNTVAYIKVRTKETNKENKKGVRWKDRRYPLCLAASGHGRRPTMAHDEDAHTRMRPLSFSRG